MKYNVSIEKEGRLYKVGTLEGTDHNDTVFTYDGAYLNDNFEKSLREAASELVDEGIYKEGKATKKQPTGLLFGCLFVMLILRR